MIALRVRDVSKRFLTRAASVEALRGVSLAVKQGAVLALLGENGAGKSTLMRLCAGLLLPDSGDIRFGVDVVSPSRRATGCLLEGSRNLYWRLTPMENLAYFGGLQGMGRQHAKERALELLARFGLFDKRAEPVQTLSRGMQQRLSVLCSLIHDPAVLLLDEPTLGLDHESSARILQIIRDVAAEGVAVVITSHQIDLMQEIASDVAILKRGRVVVSAPTASLLTDRQSLFDVQLVTSLNAGQRADLLAEFPTLRIAGRRITVDDSGDVLTRVLGRLRGCSLVSVTRGSATLGDVFPHAVLDPSPATACEVQHA